MSAPRGQRQHVHRKRSGPLTVRHVAPHLKRTLTGGPRSPRAARGAPFARWLGGPSNRRARAGSASVCGRPADWPAGHVAAYEWSAGGGFWPRHAWRGSASGFGRSSRQNSGFLPRNTLQRIFTSVQLRFSPLDRGFSPVFATGQWRRKILTPGGRLHAGGN